MAHFSENATPLRISRISAGTDAELNSATRGFKDVCLLVLPPANKLDDYNQPLEATHSFIKIVAANLQDGAVLVVLGEIGDLVETLAVKSESLRYQQWIAIKRRQPLEKNSQSLPHHHIGLLILTRYQYSLRHTKTRVRYSYCPSCDKTTKDYGGKKHTYHEFGTLMSDVWRDIEYDPVDLGPIISRLADVFGLAPYSELRVVDLTGTSRVSRMQRIQQCSIDEGSNNVIKDSRLVHGDCLETLKTLPSNSVDFAFIDPPYNLRKAYVGYSDDLAIADYFTWCDQWIYETGRVLKPGRTLALLNIPLRAVRHFLFLSSVLKFQNWIVWDALSYPVRFIMPAHYTILCFSKGPSRAIPGLIRGSGEATSVSEGRAFDALKPMAEGYCLRSECLEMRRLQRTNDRVELTDLWWDIHRLKHNTRRVDHPTQLPPHLLYRLIQLFAQEAELVFDCFNGSGTSTLAANQLGRRYLGIEKSETYHQLVLRRHEELHHGMDPFRKANRNLTAKNSPVRRLPKQKYIVPKKVLQLEVRRIAKKLLRLPTREDVIQHGRYPIELYDRYFISWGEVCAAARTTGMSEVRTTQKMNQSEEPTQLDLGLAIE